MSDTNCTYLGMGRTLMSTAAPQWPSAPKKKKPSSSRKTTSAPAPTAEASTLTLAAPSARELATFEPDDFALPTGEWPYTAADLNRLDNSDDASFYDEPRWVKHIDDMAIESLTAYYRDEIASMSAKKGGGTVDVLDLCSSWISHLPPEPDCPLGTVVGVGMNEAELTANKQLTSHVCQDLNKDPSLSQFESGSFDLICNVVSVDYLTQPAEVFREMHRLLRPGGAALMSFSNRCFQTKAVAMWLQADDIGRLTIVGSYFHYSAEWDQIIAYDLKKAPVDTPKRPSMDSIMANPGAALAWASTASAVSRMNNADPMFVVKAVK